VDDSQPGTQHTREKILCLGLDLDLLSNLQTGPLLPFSVPDFSFHAGPMCWTDRGQR